MKRTPAPVYSVREPNPDCPNPLQFDSTWEVKFNDGHSYLFGSFEYGGRSVSLPVVDEQVRVDLLQPGDVGVFAASGGSGTPVVARIDKVRRLVTSYHVFVTWLDEDRGYGDTYERTSKLYFNKGDYVNRIRPVTAKTRPVSTTNQPVSTSKNSTIAESLRQLKALHDEGILTDAEYETKRRAVEPGIPLTSSPAPERAPNAEVKIEYLRFRALHRDGLLTDQEFEAKRKELADRLR